MKSKIPAQVVVDSFSGELPQTTRFDFDKARKMRRDPTIALARAYSIAPILASTWTVEGEDERHVELIEHDILPWRTQLLRQCLLGECDFGWKAFEKTFCIKPITFSNGTTELMQCIDKLTPLKNDDTNARYKKDTGEFLGLVTRNIFSGGKILIDAAHSLFVNFDDEGLGDYAEGRMQIAELTYDQWNDANDGASRYDKKMAGSFLVVWHPVGSTMFNGKETDNAEIAKEIIRALRSSGSVSIPVDLADVMAKASEGTGGWKIEFLDPQGKQANFVDRMKYLDALKARAFGVPERAILEGEFGTKAEADIHAVAALLNMQLKHENLTEYFNCELVNQRLRANFGTEDTAWLKAVPLSDERAGLFKELLLALMADPAAGPDVKNAMDEKAILESLGVPQAVEAYGEMADAPANAPATAPANSVQPVAASAAGTNGRPAKLTVTFADDDEDDDDDDFDLELGGPGSGPHGGGAGHDEHALREKLAAKGAKLKEAHAALGKVSHLPIAHPEFQAAHAAYLKAARSYQHTVSRVQKINNKKVMS